MLRRTLNLGILAHVDAGKTTLTERLLHAAGVIDEIGSVDKGTTQTDTLALERQRGITIRSAVVSFAIGDVTVNLVDTPGHPDFIAEVERVLAVLDGAVLVVSAVEGVQPQTRILLRALQRLGIPTLLYVNKIDRAGADPERVLDAIERRLTPDVVAMGSAAGLGTRGAEFAPFGPADAELARRARAGEVHPVFFGSALTGAGVEPLSAAIASLLPAETGDAEAPASGLVFKIEREAAGERVAYVRMFSGTLHTRDRVHFGRGGEGKITAIRVFSDGTDAQQPAVTAGEIAKLSGLAEVQIGDSVGEPASRAMAHEFTPPTLESVVDPVQPDERERLRAALAQLAEQDPLIDVRQDDERQEISVSLYGEVQKEVLEAMLAADYGIAVGFRETTPLYVERVAGSGDALEVLYAKTKSNVTGKSSPDSTNPFPATLGLRVEPAPAGSGVAVGVDVDIRLRPLYIYKTSAAFEEHMAAYVRESLQEGLSGWRVIDCAVRVTDCGYRRGGTTAADFHKLTPLVLRQALERAGTIVCEPKLRVLLDVPVDTTGAVVAALARLGGTIDAPSSEGELATVEAVLSTVQLRDLQRQLAELTHGEGLLETSFESYEPVSGDPPVRR
jgi:ribosomal protection tetracycline resistance protein